MNKYYHTFGQGQANDGYYVLINATSPDLARKKMFELYGSVWAFQYTEEAFKDSANLGEYELLEEHTVYG